MTQRHIATGLIGLALLATHISGHAEPAQDSQKLAALELDPAVRHGRLSNGIEYLILENHQPRGRVSLRFAVKAGSLNETEEQRGLAHYLEHLAFDGSTHYPPGTLVEYLQRLGMGFGGDTNAFTSFDRTEYMLELPDNYPETLDKALTLFADYGDGLLLTPVQVDKERGIILGEERTRNSVGYRAEVDESRFLLPHSLIPERQPIGLDDVLQHATRVPIKAFYDSWYRPENFIVAVVGDIDAAAIETQLTRILSPVRAHGTKRPEPDLGTIDKSDGVVTDLHSDANAPATTVAIETVSRYSHVQEPDTAERRVQQLPRDLAFMMLSRRLAVLANKEGAPLTGGYAHVDEQMDFERNPTIEVTGKPGDWRALLNTAEQELRRALEYGFTAGELQEAIAAVRNNLEQAARTASTRDSRSLADALVNAPIDHQVFTTPAADLALLGPALDRVTLEDCQAALEAAWPEHSKRYVYVSGDLTLGTPEAAIAAAYQASARTPVSRPEQEAVTRFAYTDFGTPGKVTSKRTIDDLGVTLVQFENGVRLNLKRTDFEANHVLVSVRVGAGLLTEPKDAPGLALFAQGSFEAGGLGKLSSDDLQRVLAGKNVGLQFQVQDDAFDFSGGTTPTDLPVELELLTAYLTDPGYRSEAARRFEKGTEEFYAGLAHDVQGPLQLTVPQLLSTGDPRFGLPPEKLAERRTLSELKAWLTPQFASGPLEVAIVGDIDVDAAIAVVARTFGALPPRSAKPSYDRARQVTIPAQGTSRRFSVQTDVARGIVDIRWPATDQREDIHPARRLQLLASILSDRLRVRLREQMGDTYSPSARAELSPAFTGYGFIDARAIVAPDRAQAVADAIREVAADLARNGVTADELERAKAPLLTQLRQSTRDNRYWLGAVLAEAQEYPQRLDWARDRITDTRSITASELSRLAARYLSSARTFEFISIPATSGS